MNEDQQKLMMLVQLLQAHPGIIDQLLQELKQMDTQQQPQMPPPQEAPMAPQGGQMPIPQG